jgi:CRP-like cAMP-binding protein
MVSKDMLLGVPLFADLSGPEMEMMATIAEIRTCAAGETLYTEGKSGGSLYVLLKGSMRIEKIVRYDEHQSLHRLEPREFFGEVSFITGMPHSASAKAIVDSELIEIRRSEFDDLAQKSCIVAYKIMAKLALQLGKFLRTMDERFVEMVSYVWGRGKV